MRLFTDFSHNALDESPSDWTQRWLDLQATVVQDDQATAGKVLRIAPNSSQAPRLLSWDGADAEGQASVDQEIAVKWRGDTTAVNPRLVVYGSGGDSDYTGYWGGRAQGTGAHWLNAYVNGVSSVTVVGDDGVVDVSAGEWWITRYRINDGMVTIRSWPASGSEPSSWDIQRAADNSIDPGGWLGFIDFSSGVVTDLDWFSVAFDGHTAVTPPATEYEMSGGVTDLAAETAFLQHVASDTDATVETAGQSDEGRTIHLATIGNPSGTTLAITPLVHANEPAGREASLALFRDLAYSSDPSVVDYLASHQVALITPVNPDGLANGTRNTSQGDINKDYLTFNTAPARVVANTLRGLDPHIVLDAHERLQSMSTDLEYFPTGTLAVHEDLRDASEDALTAITSGLHSQGYTTMRYPVPGRVSGREAAAFHHAIGLLYETDSNIGMDRRVEVYRAALRQLLDWHESNAERLRAAKRQSKRDAIRNASSPYVLQTGDLASNGNWPSLELPENLEGYMVTGEMPAEVMEAYGLRSFDGFVPMRQAARAAVPLLFDYASDNALADAERVVEPFTEYTGDYFDGDSPDHRTDNIIYRYAWDDTPHASPSTETALGQGWHEIIDPDVVAAGQDYAYALAAITPIGWDGAGLWWSAEHDAVYVPAGASVDLPTEALDQTSTLAVFDAETEEASYSTVTDQVTLPPADEDRYVRVMVTPGAYAGEYVDGDSAPEPETVVQWDDEPHESASRITALVPDEWGDGVRYGEVDDAVFIPAGVAAYPATEPADGGTLVVRDLTAGTITRQPIDGQARLPASDRGRYVRVMATSTPLFRGPYLDEHTWDGDPDLALEWAGDEGESGFQLTAPCPQDWDGEGVYYSATREAVFVPAGVEVAVQADGMGELVIDSSQGSYRAPFEGVIPSATTDRYLSFAVMQPTGEPVSLVLDARPGPRGKSAYVHSGDEAARRTGDLTRREWAPIPSGESVPVSLDMVGNGRVTVTITPLFSEAY